MSSAIKNKRDMRQIAGGIFVLFALLVSAVSACACSHHQPAAVKDAASCHGTSHNAPTHTAAADPEAANNSFDADCSCFAKVPVPAISAKSETEKHNLAKQIAEAGEHHLEFNILLAAHIAAQQPRSYSSAKYTRLLLRSGPSRAPPRL